MDSPEYTLPGIMNYLQQEFTHIEKMKIANSLELSEMKFKIAKLEGAKNALSITNNKLVNSNSKLENDNKRLLEVIYSLKKQNLELRKKYEPDTVEESTEESKKDDKSVIDEELRQMISELSSSSSRSISVQDIKNLDPSTDDVAADRDPLNSLDLTPLITSRKFLQDCMKEMFYLIKNGNGSIVNNINEFSFDANYQENEAAKNDVDAGDFSVVDRFNYAAADSQFDSRLEEEKKPESNSKPSVKTLSTEKVLQTVQPSERSKEAPLVEPETSKEAVKTAAEAPTGLPQKTGKDQFTLLLRSPDLLKQPKSEPEEAEEGEEAEKVTAEKTVVAPQQQEEDHTIPEAYDPFYSDGASDTETIVESSEDEEEKEEQAETSASLVRKDIQLDMIEESEAEENESEYLVKITSAEKWEHNKVYSSKKCTNDIVTKNIDKFSVNEATEEVVFLSGGAIFVGKIEKEEFTMVFDGNKENNKGWRGNVWLDWADDDHYIVFSDIEPYIIRVFNKTEAKEVAKINVIDDLKARESKKNEGDSDSDEEEDGALLPLRDSTVLFLDYNATHKLLLTTCNKFYYVYNLSNLNDIELLTSVSLQDSSDGISSIKLGKFVNDNEILLLSNNGVLEHVHLQSDKTEDSIINLGAHKSVKLTNFYTIKGNKKKIVLMLENFSGLSHVYRVLDIENSKLITDSSVIVKPELKGKTKKEIEALKQKFANGQSMVSDVLAFEKEEELYLIENSMKSFEAISVIDCGKREIESMLCYFDKNESVPEEKDVIVKWSKQGILMGGYDSSLRCVEMEELVGAKIVG